MFHDGGFVEALDKGAPVIAGGHDAVVFQLDQRLLNRNAADPEPHRDLIAVDAVATAQFPRQYQVENVRNDLVLFFDPVLFWHPFLECLSNPVRST